MPSYAFNPATGRVEDENGNPVGAVPLDQMQPAAAGPPPTGMLAANARAGMNLQQPITVDGGGNEGMGLAQQLGAPAPPAEPVAPPAPLPPPMVRDTQSVTREVVSPAERAAMRQAQGLDRQAVDIAGQQGETEKLKAQQEAEAAKARAGARQGFAQQTTTAVDEDALGVAKAKAKYEAESARLASMDVKDYWADKSVGHKVAAVIAMAMGAFGAALAGRGGNQAIDVINNTVEQDYRLQRAKIEVQERRVAGAKEAVGAARQAHSDRIADLELTQAAAWNAVGAAAEAKAAQNGTQAAAVQAAAIKNMAQQKAQAHLMQWMEGQRAKVTSTSVTGTGSAGGAGAGRAAGIQIQKAQLAEHGAAALATMDQALAAGFRPNQADIERMQNNEKEMATAAHGGVLAATIGRGTGILARSKYQGLSPQAQQFFQAADILAQKAAAIASPSHAAEEVDHVRQMFSLNPGDTPQIMQQKLDQARGVIGAAKALGGKFTGQAAAGAEAERRNAPPPGISGGGGQGPDQAKVQMARQRLQANPNDTVARDWLAAHGL